MHEGSRQLPVTGAWRPGDPVGRRQFLSMPEDRTFVLEGGGQLKGVTVAYETWGELDPAGANAVLVCHAITGDSHVAGRQAPGHPTAGWWEDMVGPGRPVDTDRYFVVCVNVLGGCQGTTGPASDRSRRPARPYGADFPVVSVRDIVRTQAAVADQLGIARWLAVVGGSMGGMQVLEWGVMYPLRVRSLRPAGHDRGGQRLADLVQPGRPPGRPARPEVAGRATTTTPRPATGPTPAWPWPA